ncbi:Glycosyl hydrolase family 32 domain protein [Chthoniobacter flavus Ellin428]|uniref:Glycosyl hydrolase family 32 domain protein n=1 Tax=Chthoniobacter flavus Ellin428 TaxID=497964 RepID=B4D460_9BACT|nr:hypothetical protein [Chthoniobacter flavus]EDY18661.1 Glycosyl hydrolase family 32 domain protein [Chthoniobacter flavus Ellin428]TCO89100.1 hypothetical protein EV701_115135 [Chthoniobacter flavus]
MNRLLPLVLLALSGAIVCAADNDGELLYNGIRLPHDWPPRDDVKAASREVPPVPYLDAPPAVIPIDVGRQLFVDDFLIEKTTLHRTFHHAEKYEGNPILKPETPEEIHGAYSHAADDPTATACPFDDGVFYDPTDHLFKMWYMGGFWRNTCLATSRDGLHWTRPKLDVQAGTNVVIPFRPDFYRDAFSPWLDWTATNPAERWKAFIYARIAVPGEAKRHGASYLYTSPDGIHWTDTAQVKANVDDNTTIFYNPFRKKWVMSVRRHVPERGRARLYYETDTFPQLAAMKTDDPVFWSGADELDPADPQIPTQKTTQLYCLSPIAYESILLGAFAIHYGPENGECQKGKFPKLTEIELGYSRDGFHFARPDRTSFIAATKREGDWDRGYVRPIGSVCTVVGDRLYFYYSAFSGVAPDGQKHFYAGGSTHVAFLRRDGFASMDADAQDGELLTRPITFQGTHLFVNAAAAKGEVRAEIVNEKGAAIAPFTADNCQPLTADKTLQAVHWKGADDLSALRGRPVRIRFLLKDASLYAFWVSPEATGASHGYVAAGGPGFTGPTDTVGQSAQP